MPIALSKRAAARRKWHPARANRKAVGALCGRPVSGDGRFSWEKVDLAKEICSALSW